MEELPEDANKETEAAKKQRHLELARSAQLRRGNWGGSLSVCKILPLSTTCLGLQKLVSFGVVSIHINHYTILFTYVYNSSINWCKL